MNRRQFLLSAALLSSGLLPARAEAPASHWRSAAALPVRTQEIYPAVHRGKLYVAGGIARRLGVPYFSNRCFSYDPASDQWTEIAALPEALHHAALASDGDALIVVGGFNGGYTHVWRMRARVYRLHAEGWVEDGRLPGPQAEGVLATSPDGDIHLVTGQMPRGTDNSARSDHVEVVDHRVRAAGNNTWESLAPIPTPRNSATGGWMGEQLIVTGGRTARGNLDATEIYDLREDRWRSAAPLPLPQAGTASVVTEDGLIVFGGEIFQPHSAVFPNVWHYSVSRDEWTAMPDMPTPRHGLGAGRFGNEVFVVGGATEPGGSGTTDANEVLTLGTGGGT
jgi:N-acetylneuraminic acid mutarotase